MSTQQKKKYTYCELVNHFVPQYSGKKRDERNGTKNSIKICNNEECEGLTKSPEISRFHITW